MTCQNCLEIITNLDVLDARGWCPDCVEAARYDEYFWETPEYNEEELMTETVEEMVNE